MRRARPLVLASATAFALAATTLAGGRKIMVLPCDGNADPALRAKLDASIQKLAHQLDGDVKPGTTSFGDAALAVGCDPAEPKCADTVLSTLGVDELVWATATTTNGDTTLVVKRASKGAPEQDQTVALAAKDSPDQVEDPLQPLFGGVSHGSAAVGSGVGSDGMLGSGSAALGSGSAAPVEWSHDRKLGVGLAAGGGLALVLGVALWASASSMQSDIDSAPTNTLDQIKALKDKEDSAGTYATWGNVMVIAGVAAGAVGAYYLWKDHEAGSTTAVIAPADKGTGATLVLRGAW